MGVLSQVISDAMGLPNQVISRGAFREAPKDSLRGRVALHDGSLIGTRLDGRSLTSLRPGTRPGRRGGTAPRKHVGHVTCDLLATAGRARGGGGGEGGGETAAGCVTASEDRMLFFCLSPFG